MRASITGFDYFKQQVQPELQAIVSDFFHSVLSLYQNHSAHIPPLLVQAARQFTEEKEKALYIQALEQVQQAQAPMLNTFAFHLLEGLQYFSGENIAQLDSAQVEHNFTVLEAYAREDDLLLHSLTVQCIKHNQNTLDALHEYVERALAIRIEPLLSPFNPMLIAHALHASFAVKGIHSRVKKTIFSSFNDSFFQPLEGIYAHALGQFQSLSSSLQLDDSDAHPDSSAAFDIDFNETLLHGVIPADFNSTTPAPHTNANKELTQKELLTLLASIQKGYDPATDGLLIHHLKHQLTMDATGDNIAAPSLRDQNIINLLSLIFRQLANTVDEKIADLLLRLCVPYARILLCDELLLHDQQHPARTFLNALMQLAHSNPNDLLAFKQVQLFVTKVLMRYTGEEQLFSDLGRELETLLSHYQYSAPQCLDDIAAQAEDEERQQQLRQAIASFVHRLTQNLNHELSFQQLLDIFLQDLLYSIYTKQGKNSIEWKNALQLIQQLLRLFDSSDNVAFKAAKKELSTTVASLNRYLTALGISPLWRRSFFDQMKEIQILLNRGVQLHDIHNEQLQYTHAIELMIEHYESAWAAATIDSYTIGHQHTEEKAIVPLAPSRENAEAIIDNLRRGQWINIMINSQRTPCFFSQISQKTHRYIFYNRQHQKLFERQREDLIDDFYRGFAFLSEHTTSFDSALHSLIKQLKAH